jgi:hypothetical protein
MPMMAPANVRDDEDISEFDYNAFEQSFEDQLKSTPSINPYGMLQVGLEKYALGRRFLITKKGYFGLGRETSRKETVLPSYSARMSR